MIIFNALICIKEIAENLIITTIYQALYIGRIAGNNDRTFTEYAICQQRINHSQAAFLTTLKVRSVTILIIL